MDYNNSLQASFWFMVLLQTIGSVDMPGSGPRKMPSPRSYLAIIIVWAVLQLLADTGKGRDRAASVAGWVIILAGAVSGPFGSKLNNLITSATNLTTASQQQSPSGG